MTKKKDAAAAPKKAAENNEANVTPVASADAAAAPEAAVADAVTADGAAAFTAAADAPEVAAAAKPEKKAELVKIKITRSTESRAVPVSLNGKSMDIPVGKAVDVPEYFLPVLDDSSCEYEIVRA